MFTPKRRGWKATLFTVLTAVVVMLSVGTTAPAARADYGGDADTIFATVNYDSATYDAALPQLEALVDQAGMNRSDLEGIMLGMYAHIQPSSNGGNILNQLVLARVIENQIAQKFVNPAKYHGTRTDDVWINPDNTDILTFEMRPVDSDVFYLDVGDGLRLLSVSEDSPSYLVGDEDLSLGRCAWTTSNSCQKTAPGSVQTISAMASSQPSTVQVGQVLTPQPEFSVPPWRVLYKWIRDTDSARTVVQVSTTSATYTVQAADAGARLSCLVYPSLAGYAMNPYGGVEQGSWNEIPVSPGSTPPVEKTFTKAYTPTISGTAKVGRTLTEKVKSWKPSASISRQWFRDGVPIDGATGKTYKLIAADLGAAITVAVTGTRTGYTTVTKTSKPTKAVGLGTLARGKVKVTGTKRVGKPLTAKTWKWSKDVTYWYQWYRNGHKIDSATGKTYALTALDKGKRIKAKVWTTKDAYKMPQARYSKTTSKIGLGYLGKITPGILGDPVVGGTLTVDPGPWTPAETVLTFKWYHRVGKKWQYIGAEPTCAPTEPGYYKVTVTGHAPGYHTSSLSNYKLVTTP